MFKNYFTVILRSLWNNKLFSVIILPAYLPGWGLQCKKNREVKPCKAADFPYELSHNLSRGGEEQWG